MFVSACAIKSEQEQLFDLPMDEILSVVSPADRIDTVQLSKMELF